MLLGASCQSPAENTNTTGQGKASPTDHTLTVAELSGFLDQNPEVILLDVRTPQEIAAGKLEGAVEMDIMNPNFQTQLNELDKQKTYVVYCRSGRRSDRACQMMGEMGFTNYYNLEGGMNAYQQQNH